MSSIQGIGSFVQKAGDSYDVPQGVRNAAKRGLELRKKQPKSKKAGLDIRQASAQGIGSGVARARDLVSGRVSASTIRRMNAYFSRHAKNYKLDPGKKPTEDKGYVAGLLWGGEAGKIWAARMVTRFKREEMKKAKTFPVGTVRTHGGVKKKKTAQGWVPVEAEKPKKGAAEEALEAIESKGHANPFNPKEIVFYFSQDGKLYVKMDASVLQGKIHLSEITVSPDGRGKGLGSKILKRITDEADKSGVAVTLIPKPIGDGGLNTKQLKDWYGRHGFKMKQGLMVREPSLEKGRAHAFPIGTKRKEKEKGFDEQTVLKALWLTLEFYKARPTKYIRRVPKPGGGYRYYYRESSIGRAAREGENVRLGDRSITIKSIDEVGRMVVSDGDGQFVFTPDQWRETLNDYYGETYEKAAGKRARQAINAVMRLVPSKTLEGLEGTDLQRLEQLKKKSPELFSKLEKSFSRAGMTAYEAKMFINQTLSLKGWEMEARSTLVGSVLSSKGSFAAKNYRRIIAASENLADGQDVRAGHVQGAVDSLYSVFERNIISRKLKKAGGDVTGVLRRVLEAQKKGPISPADAQDLLKGLLGSEALQSISVTAKAVPGFQKNPQVQKIDAGLKKAVMEVMPKGVGKDTKVFVAGEGGKPIALKGKYKLVSAKEAIPSHDPQSFSQNSKYPKGLQERAYHRDKSEQNKVIRNAQRMNPEFVINTNPDALNGPPIVTKDGIVLGGNSRTMSMQRIYTEGGAKAKELKDYLRGNAAQMGFTKKDVDAIEDPIVVRVVSTVGQDEKLLVRQMNEGFIQALDPRTMQVAMGRRLDDKAMESLGDAMEDTDTLRSFLDSKRARPFISSLNRAGIIDERNRNQYVNQKTGQLNEDGKTLVERILVGRVVNDPDLLSNTMPSMVGAVARAVPYMVQAESYGAGYNVRDDLRYAVQAFNRMNDLGLSPGHAKGKELDRKLQEIKSHFDDLFEGKHPVLTNPRAEAIFDNFLKRGGPRQISSTFKEYAKQASKNPENQAALFGSISPLEVFNQSVVLSSKQNEEL